MTNRLLRVSILCVCFSGCKANLEVQSQSETQNPKTEISVQAQTKIEAPVKVNAQLQPSLSWEKRLADSITSPTDRRMTVTVDGQAGHIVPIAIDSGLWATATVAIAMIAAIWGKRAQDNKSNKTVIAIVLAIIALSCLLYIAKIA